jgi:hypothetical protein
VSPEPWSVAHAGWRVRLGAHFRGRQRKTWWAFVLTTLLVGTSGADQAAKTFIIEDSLGYTPDQCCDCEDRQRRSEAPEMTHVKRIDISLPLVFARLLQLTLEGQRPAVVCPPIFYREGNGKERGPYIPWIGGTRREEMSNYGRKERDGRGRNACRHRSPPHALSGRWPEGQGRGAPMN